jgi:ribonuclease BN (tRNA processing enzyme)
VKVVVLGGSAAGPNTGAGCSGYLIVEEETSVAIDLGPGTLPELRRHVDFKSLSAIVISHYHLDHILDIGALRYLGKYNPKPVERQIPLHVPPGTAARFASWAQVFGDPNEPAFLEDVFSIREYDPSESLRIGEVSIEMKRTVHPVLAHAMRVTGADGSAFGYTADTGPSVDLVDLLAGVRLLAAEATESANTDQPEDSRGHLTAMEAGQLAANAGARALILAHRGEELGLDLAAFEARQAFDGPVMIAHPGLTVFI